MKNDIRQLSKESSDALIAAITTASIKSLIEKTKAADDKDSGSFKIVVSTSDPDRQGESVNQSGWDLTFYKMNPVVLWAHDYGSLPIGMCSKIEVENGKLVAEGKFAPADANPFAQQVRRLYELGMVNATSVGFIPKEYDMNMDGVINRSELLEFSFVPVPANPMALRLDEIKQNNLDTQLLKTKGIEISVKEDAPAPAPEPEKAPEPTPDPAPTPEPEAQPEKPAPEPETPPVTPTVEEEIKSIHTKLDTIILALGSVKLSDGKEVAEAKNIITPSLDEVNVFVETRELLRTIDKAVENALEKYNKAARDRKQK